MYAAAPCHDPHNLCTRLAASCWSAEGHLTQAHATLTKKREKGKKEWRREEEERRGGSMNVRKWKEQEK
jgi:hypothetical protein